MKKDYIAEVYKKDLLRARETIYAQKEVIGKLLEENKELKNKLSEITMITDDEKQSIEHILELEEENKRLKELVQYLA